MIYFHPAAAYPMFYVQTCFQHLYIDNGRPIVHCWEKFRVSNYTACAMVKMLLSLSTHKGVKHFNYVHLDLCRPMYVYVFLCQTVWCV